MTFIGPLSPVSNRATWSENFELIDEDDGEHIDLTDATEITVEVRDSDSQSPLLTATLANGKVTLLYDEATVTMTIDTPTTATLVNHDLQVEDPISFTTTGTLPTGVTAGTTYYVTSSALTEDAFRFSATLGGSNVHTSGTQSGVHTLQTARSGTFQWRFEATEMDDLYAKQHEITILIEQGDDTVHLLEGTVNVFGTR